MNEGFYHIIIENKENEFLYEFDISGLQKFDEIFTTPYIDGKDLFIDGQRISKENIKSIHVKLTLEPLNVLIKRKERTSIQYGIYYDKKDILKDSDLAQDITRDLFSKMADTSSSLTSPKIKSCSKVFIVHGHDDLAKIEVARFIEKLGLEAIILSEQPNGGKTIIEKIEDYANVGFAIVLYTPCDEGKVKGSSDLKQRARQNVVFEHGFFIGRLGRNRVHALKKGEIELPNDISGVVYTPMDEAKAWQLEVAKEMKDVGYNIDLNKWLKSK